MYGYDSDITFNHNYSLEIYLHLKSAKGHQNWLQKVIASAAVSAKIIASFTNALKYLQA